MQPGHCPPSGRSMCEISGPVLVPVSWRAEIGVRWCQLCRSVPRAQHPVQHTLTHVDTSSHMCRHKLTRARACAQVSLCGQLQLTPVPVLLCVSKPQCTQEPGAKRSGQLWSEKCLLREKNTLIHKGIPSLASHRGRTQCSSVIS